MMRRLLPLLLGLLCVACSRDPEPEGNNGATDSAASEKLHSPTEFAELADIKLYPHATFPENASNIRRDKLETRYEIVMVTKDTPAQVEKFYRTCLENPDHTGQSLLGTTPKHYFAMVNTEKVEKGTKVRVVVIESKVDFKGQAPTGQ